MKTNLNQFEIDVKEKQLNLPLTCVELGINEQIEEKWVTKKNVGDYPV